MWIINVALSIGIGVACFVVFLILGLVLIGSAVALFSAGYTTAGILVGTIGGSLFLTYLQIIAPLEAVTPQPDQGA